MESKDPSKKHFNISMIKSILRIGGLCFLFADNGLIFFAMLSIIAEILGIFEEF